MRVFRNKASGKHFVYVEDHGNGKALFILPQGEAKSLKLGLFEQPKEGEREDFLAHGLITDEQDRRYQQVLDALEL